MQRSYKYDSVSIFTEHTVYFYHFHCAVMTGSNPGMAGPPNQGMQGMSSGPPSQGMQVMHSGMQGMPGAGGMAGQHIGPGPGGMSMSQGMGPAGSMPSNPAMGGPNITMQPNMGENTGSMGMQSGSVGNVGGGGVPVASSTGMSGTAGMGGAVGPGTGLGGGGGPSTGMSGGGGPGSGMGGGGGPSGMNPLQHSRPVMGVPGTQQGPMQGSMGGPAPSQMPTSMMGPPNQSVDSIQGGFCVQRISLHVRSSSLVVSVKLFCFLVNIPVISFHLWIYK